MRIFVLWHRLFLAAIILANSVEMGRLSRQKQVLGSIPINPNDCVVGETPSKWLQYYEEHFPK
jgi:hypothetical protein